MSCDSVDRVRLYSDTCKGSRLAKVPLIASPQHSISIDYLIVFGRGETFRPRVEMNYM